MTITLTPDTEQLIVEELKHGNYKDAEDVIQRALHALHATHQVSAHVLQECQEAAAQIRALRKGVTLGGIALQDLIHAEHRY